MKFIEVRDPRYSDKCALVGKYRLTAEKNILWFSKAKFLKDKRFIIYKKDIGKYETDRINNFDCIKIPIEKLRNISTKEIIRTVYYEQEQYTTAQRTAKEFNNIDGQVLLTKTQLDKKPVRIITNGCLFQIQNDTPISIMEINNKKYFAINIFDLTLILLSPKYTKKALTIMMFTKAGLSEKQIENFLQNNPEYNTDNQSLTIKTFNKNYYYILYNQISYLKEQN